MLWNTFFFKLLRSSIPTKAISWSLPRIKAETQKIKRMTSCLLGVFISIQTRFFPLRIKHPAKFARLPWSHNIRKYIFISHSEWTSLWMRPIFSSPFFPQSPIAACADSPVSWRHWAGQPQSIVASFFLSQKEWELCTQPVGREYFLRPSSQMSTFRSGRERKISMTNENWAYSRE